MHTVRTTKRPWEEIEVGDAEFLDLQRQGLLAEDDEPPTPDPGPATTKKAAPPTGASQTKEG
jgi:hypothetical protein